MLANNGPESEELVKQCSKLNWYPTLNMGVSVPTGLKEGNGSVTLSVSV